MHPNCTLVGVRFWILRRSPDFTRRDAGSAYVSIKELLWLRSRSIVQVALERARGLQEK